MPMTLQEAARKGGKARAKKLSAKRRSEIAGLAGSQSWKKTKRKKKRLAGKRRSADITSRRPG